MNTFFFTPELKHGINIAQSIARENAHNEFSSAHLLKGILHNEVGLAALISAWGKDVHYLRDWADIRIEGLPKALNYSGEIRGDAKIGPLLEVADLERMKLGQDTLSPLAVLAAMCKPDLAFSAEQLRSFPLTERELLAAGLEETKLQDAVQTADGTENKPGAAATITNLFKYCVNVTEQARSGKIEPIIGREKETRTMIEILGKRNKPNPIIIGEPGVGKTALVEAFALDIVRGNVPGHLQNAQLFALDLGALIAGASYKGEVEDRIKKIIGEVKQFEKAILFIDEIHTILDNRNGYGGIANLLKPELARGVLTVIGASTNKEYREFIETDNAFHRRFEKVVVEEPKIEVAVRMLAHITDRYAMHHGIPITATAVEEAVHLSARYLNDKRLPDAALDLIDTTMSAVKMMVETSGREVESLLQILENLGDSAPREDYRWLRLQIENRLSPVLVGQMEDDTVPEDLQNAKAHYDHLHDSLQHLTRLSRIKKEEIDATDIAAVIAVKTGIPLGKVQGRERERLLQMEDHLRQRVVGQDQALKIVQQAILESRAGLKKAGQPVGSFFFCGPTGTGKTELAKSLAEFLFNDEKALIRFDMSEFKESNSAALLYGASPGYVGYKEGGLLVNKIRETPYAVVLFDEIEKAHESIYDLFLQILDDGIMTDKLGRKGDFSNAIILFTSNLGYQEIATYTREHGRLPDSKTLHHIMKGLTKMKGFTEEPVFRPEFVGRVDAFVPFAPITEEVALTIFEIQSDNLKNILRKLGIKMIITDEAAARLTSLGHDPELGARPIRDMIRTQLRQPLARMIIARELREGDSVKVELEQGEVVVRPETRNLVSDTI